MAQRINRARNLLVNDTTVTDEVAAGSISSNYFDFGKKWPLPGILLSHAATPFDEQIGKQDIHFTTKCFAESDTIAESIHQIVRTSLTGHPDFGIMTADEEGIQKPIWAAQDIYRIVEVTGGQSLEEPTAGQRGRPFVLATYRAEFIRV